MLISGISQNSVVLNISFKSEQSFEDTKIFSYFKFQKFKKFVSIENLG